MGNNVKVVEFDGSGENLIKKMQKLFKSQKLSKLGKKLLKNENLSLFQVKKTRLSF